jgi:hypothetical protein
LVNVPSDALAVRPPQSVERGGTEARTKHALSSLPLAAARSRSAMFSAVKVRTPRPSPIRHPRFQTVVGRQICFPLASTSSASFARD